MSNFKIKKNKIEKTDIKDMTTLDKKHKEHLKIFKNEKNDLSDKIKKIDKLNQELNLISINKITYTDSELELRANILNEIETLENEVNIIKENKNEVNYYDKTGDIIRDYYKLRDNDCNEYFETKNIFDFFKKKKNTDNNTRSNLFNKYCQRVDGVRIQKDDGTQRIKYCLECNIEKILDYGESSYICPICGDSEEVIVDEDKQIKEYSPYKRINHFKEWINQFQAKESTEISESVFSEIINEINKHRITDYKDLTRNILKQILKKLGYNNLYEHIPFILNKITGKNSPCINRNVELKFMDMFSQIQDPWDRHKPHNRKNFLSYSYVLHKFCQLLELDHLLSCFPLLKSTKNLKEQEHVWEKICRELKWEFISSL